MAADVDFTRDWRKSLPFHNRWRGRPPVPKHMRLTGRNWRQPQHNSPPALPRPPSLRCSVFAVLCSHPRRGPPCSLPVPGELSPHHDSAPGNSVLRGLPVAPPQERTLPGLERHSHSCGNSTECTSAQRLCSSSQYMHSHSTIGALTQPATLLSNHLTHANPLRTRHAQGGVLCTLHTASPVYRTMP